MTVDDNKDSGAKANDVVSKSRVYMRPVASIPLVDVGEVPRSAPASMQGSRRINHHLPTPGQPNNFVFEATTPDGIKIRFTRYEMDMDVNSKVINFCTREGTKPSKFAESISYNHSNMMRRLDRTQKRGGQPLPLWAALAFEWRTGGYIQPWEWVDTAQHKYWMRRKVTKFARLFERQVLSGLKMGGVTTMPDLLAKKSRVLAKLYGVNWEQAKSVSVSMTLHTAKRVTVLSLPPSIGPNDDDTNEDDNA